MVQSLPFGRRGKGFRYLEFLSAIDDPGDGVGRLARIARTINEQARSYRGFNFFDEKDEDILPAIARGEFNIGGMQSRVLRSLLPRYSSSQISRILKRLRVHGLLRKAPRGYKYYPGIQATHCRSSSDSRVWGFVDRSDIYGKAVFAYWPLDKIGRGFQRLQGTSDRHCGRYRVPSNTKSASSAAKAI